MEPIGIVSFKESPLRKQSVYRKFDPPLKDSPQRPTPVTPETGSAGEADAPSSGSPPEAKLVEFDFFRARDAPVPGWPCVSSGRGYVPIVDMLQRSMDLDATVKPHKRRTCC